MMPQLKSLTVVQVRERLQLSRWHWAWATQVDQFDEGRLLRWLPPIELPVQSTSDGFPDVTDTDLPFKSLERTLWEAQHPDDPKDFADLYGMSTRE